MIAECQDLWESRAIKKIWQISVLMSVMCEQVVSFLFIKIYFSIPSEIHILSQIHTLGHMLDSQLFTVRCKALSGFSKTKHISYCTTQNLPVGQNSSVQVFMTHFVKHNHKNHQGAIKYVHTHHTSSHALSFFFIYFFLYVVNTEATAVSVYHTCTVVCVG